MQCNVCVQLQQQQKTLQARRKVQETSNTQKLETKLRGLHFSWSFAVSEYSIQCLGCIMSSFSHNS